MRFADPATAITDYILAVECFVLAVLTLPAHQMSISIWGAALAVTGVSALIGGIYHHGRLQFTPENNRRLQNATAAGLLLCFALYVSAGLFAVAVPPLLYWLLCAVLLLVVIGVTRMFRAASPGVSQKTIPVLLLVLAGLLVLLIRYRESHGVYILVGAILCCAGAVIQQSQIRIHRHFNHNDICHVFFMAGVYFLWRGGLLLNDKI